MTKEEEHNLHTLETRVRQLILAYKELEGTNTKLQDLLRQKDEEITALNRKKAQMQADYDLLKAAKVVQISSQDAKEARARINRLIREVDKCIALLNV